jgi:hypothetical protein
MKIKFFCAKYEKATKAWYQQVISLAEGFIELGTEEVEFFGNINYWFDNERNEYLIKEDNNSDYDVAIYSFQYFESGNDMRSFNPNKFNVLYDHADGYGFWSRCTHIPFNLILRSHYNIIYENQYSKNVIPWFFYLPTCVINEIDKYSHNIEEDVYVNFRLSHGLRTTQFNKIKSDIGSKNIYHNISEGLDIIDDSNGNLTYWSQTGRRFDSNYFEELSKHRFTFAFGGELIGNGLYQYDSWRFWEVMYSNSIPIHMNLEENGCKFPINPKHEKEYIGVDTYYDYKKLLKYSKKDLVDISKQGKLFVKDNYNCKNIAKIFLAKI